MLIQTRIQRLANVHPKFVLSCNFLAIRKYKGPDNKPISHDLSLCVQKQVILRDFLSKLGVGLIELRNIVSGDALHKFSGIGAVHNDEASAVKFGERGFFECRFELLVDYFAKRKLEGAQAHT